MKLLCPLWLALLPVVAAGGVLDNVGYTRLRAELGDATPAGHGMRVTQVESQMLSDHDGDPATPKVRTWQPDVGARGLASKRIVVHAPTPGAAHSRHATAIAGLLIGRRGMATAGTLEVRAVSDWMTGELRAFSPHAPLASTSRVFNHSWAATIPGGDGRILRRVDWLADRDEIIHVVGVRNSPDHVNQPLLAAAFNVVAVGRSDGEHSRGTPRIDSTYGAGRARPHIVVPANTTSAATPVVASAALLLAELAATPALSASATATLTRGGLSLRDAGRPEVLRAVLMASAGRATHNGVYPDIDGYRATPAVRTDNGLDVRYGAGQLDIYRAWHLLRAGEQEPSDDLQDVAMTGFDYMPDLRGEGGGTATADYYLETDTAGEFSATLSWHLSFAGGAGGRFDSSAELNDLDLCLYQLQGGRERVLSASTATHDTTENLHLKLPPGRYRLEVRYKDVAADEAAASQDYGLAWQFLAAGAD